MQYLTRFELPPFARQIKRAEESDENNLIRAIWHSENGTLGTDVFNETQTIKGLTNPIQTGMIGAVVGE